MESEKKIWIVSVLGVATLIIVAIGATYAYFSRYSSDPSLDVPTNVKTGTTDSLVLSVNSDITILATPDNYGAGMPSEVGTSIAKAVLRANSNTKYYSDHYYVYFDITKNEFIYTTASKQPELLLKIIDPDGNEVTSMDGLEYKSVFDCSGNTLSGFDITTFHDMLTIASNYEITTNIEKIDMWKISVSFVNLTTPQKENTGKSFSAKIYMQKEEMKVE